MKLHLEATSDLHEIPVSATEKVTTRVWKGRTESGIEIEAFIVVLIPLHTNDIERFQAECRDMGMKPTREVNDWV